MKKKSTSKKNKLPAFSHKELHSAIKKAQSYINSTQLTQALSLLLPALAKHPNEPDLLLLTGIAYRNLGEIKLAVQHLKSLLELAPTHHYTALLLAQLYQSMNDNEQALNYINKAEKIKHEDANTIILKGVILSNLHRYDEAIELLENTDKKNHYQTFNNLGLLYQNIGLLAEAESCYKKAMEHDKDDDVPYNNYLTLAHYIPHLTKDYISSLYKNWQSNFITNITKIKKHQSTLIANRKIRLGMISDGFRTHPVGQMITSALEALPNHEFEIFAYSTNHIEDNITHRIKQLASNWLTISHLNPNELAEQIVADEIDILFDLCGHNNGSRMRTMAKKPAPILVKWVGGLINTTGLSTIDYLLSDYIETPIGEDEFYTENIIRLPDDYICYNPPSYTPDVAQLPALHNDYITLGCFNNPTKINEVLLKEWARILHSLPNSRLFLKGLQFGSKKLRQNVMQTLTSEGINDARITIEGPSNHDELLKTYNKIDIALDPWPYSGGLTTCEALFMGVPVVTLSGPTFAGRHSATHLTNVCLSQLVAEDWQQYHDIVVNLASDLDNLANIRTHLRTALLESPVCDAPRFARNFSNAMRAIWQRHCEGKAPIALSLDKDGNAQFVDEDKPVTLQLPEEPITVENNDEFRFQFQGRITTLDNGASLVASHKFSGLQKLGALSTLCIDPGSKVKNSQQLNHLGDFHHFPMTVLGDGSTVPLYITVDPALTSTLVAVPSTPRFFASSPQAPEIISELPIQTLALDSLEAITTLDWLILDRLHNNQRILKHGQQKLATALVIQVGINLQPAYQQQADLTTVCQQLHELGFRFLTMTHLGSYSHFADRKDILTQSTSELPYVEALFIPNDQRLLTMDNNSKTKLAFLLHSAYQLKDISYQLLASIDTIQAENYLLGENLISASSNPQTAKPDQSEPEQSATTFELPTAPAMTIDEQQLFLSYVKKAKNYFEFGSGGSTVWAVQQGLTVQGIESDPAWVQALQEQLGQQCQVNVADIGPTGDWGYPLTQQTDKFPRYSQAILEHQQPFDLILIDGRFRVACTMAAIQHIAQHHAYENSFIFIHDFWNRAQYRSVLKFLVFIEQVDSAGVFKVKKDIELNDVADMWLRFSTNPE